MLTIIGAAGRTGGSVADSLLVQGPSPHVLVRNPEAATRWRARGGTVTCVDLGDRDALTLALTGSTGLFAILPEDLGVPDVAGHRRHLADVLAASVLAAGTPHVVFLSSISTAGPARELRYAEEALTATGCTLTILRSPYFQENLAAAIPYAREHGLVANLLPSAHIAIPMVAIADVADIAAWCLRHPPARSQIVTFAAPRYSMADAADHLGRALGRPLEVKTVPAAEQLGFLCGGELPPAFAASLVELYAALGALAGAANPTDAAMATTPLARTLEGLVGAAPGSSDRRTVPAVVDALTTAWNRHDLEAMGLLYRTDADFVNIFGGLLRGRAEIVGEHVERHRVMFARAVMTSSAPEIRWLRPTVAVARVAWTMRGITGPDGVPARDRAGLMLHVLERTGDQWSIVATQNTELATDAPRRLLDQSGQSLRA